MPDLRSWLERGGFLLLRPWSHGPRTASVHPGAYPKVDESLDGLGRMHSRLELHPRALSTEARHLVPRRRMGALGGAPRSQETASPQTPDHPSEERPFDRRSVGIRGNDAQTGMLPGRPESAGCVRGLRDSPNSAIRTTYRVSPRSSSAWEPRYPSSKVVD